MLERCCIIGRELYDLLDEGLLLIVLMIAYLVRDELLAGELSYPI
jgi:hypothetical protein